jgi:hypothetical protein
MHLLSPSLRPGAYGLGMQLYLERFHLASMLIVRIRCLPLRPISRGILHILRTSKESFPGDTVTDFQALTKEAVNLLSRGRDRQLTEQQLLQLTLHSEDGRELG